MNTKNRNGFRGFGFYAVLILVVVLIWYGLSGNTTTSSYTKSDFQKALQKNDVTYVKIVQNREIPTGSLRIKLKDGSQQYLYTSDVNEMQDVMDDEKVSLIYDEAENRLHAQMAVLGTLISDKNK